MPRITALPPSESTHLRHSQPVKPHQPHSRILTRHTGCCVISWTPPTNPDRTDCRISFGEAPIYLYNPTWLPAFVLSIPNPKSFCWLKTKWYLVILFYHVQSNDVPATTSSFYLIPPSGITLIVYSNLVYHQINCSTCNPASPSAHSQFGQETHPTLSPTQSSYLNGLGEHR